MDRMERLGEYNSLVFRDILSCSSCEILEILSLSTPQSGGRAMLVEENTELESCPSDLMSGFCFPSALSIFAAKLPSA